MKVPKSKRGKRAELWLTVAGFSTEDREYLPQCVTRSQVVVVHSRMHPGARTRDC